MSRRERRPLTAEQRALAERYWPLARGMAQPFKARWPSEWEEFDSAAGLAIVEAAESFDAGRNVKFATFASMRVHGALHDVQRRMGRLAIERGRECDIDTPPIQYQASLEELGTVINTTPDREPGAEIESRDEVESWIRQLPPQHAAICRAIYIDGRNQTQTAALAGCSQSWTSFLHRQARAMLRGSIFGTPETNPDHACDSAN